MKKFLLLLFAAASLAACDDDKDYGPDIEHYTGRLTVTLLSDATQCHTYDGKRFSLAGDTDGTLTMRMYDTQFVPQMPPLTMDVPGIGYLHSTDDLLTLEAARVVPLMGGRPYEQYAITALKGTVADAEPEDRLHVEFDCMGYRVVYDGEELD